MNEPKIYVETGLAGRCEARVGAYRNGGLYLSLIYADGPFVGEVWRDLTIETPSYLRDEMAVDCVLVPWDGITAAVIPQLETKLLLSRTSRVARFEDGEVAAVCRIRCPLSPTPGSCP